MGAIAKPVPIKNPRRVSSVLTSTQAIGAWVRRNRTEGYDQCVLLVRLEVRKE